VGTAVELRLQLVQPELYEVVWPKAVPYLVPALKHAHDGMTIEQLRFLLARREAQLLVMIDPDTVDVLGAVVMSIKDYANFRVGFVLAAGGYGPTTQKRMYEDLELYAKANGCRYIEGNVRKSIARLLRKVGFEEVCAVVRKQL